MLDALFENKNKSKTPNKPLTHHFPDEAQDLNALFGSK